jgi:hypothetical protein
MPSPKKLKPATARAIAIPGKTGNHHASSIYVRAPLSMFPQDAVGGWIPSPRKLRLASRRIALEM